MTYLSLVLAYRETRWSVVVKYGDIEPQPAIAHQPGETPFDDPAPWLNREARNIGDAPDNLQIPPAVLCAPVRQRSARVRSIRPTLRQAWDERLQPSEHAPSVDFVMDACPRHPD